MTNKKLTDKEIIKDLECCKNCCCKQCNEEPDFQEAINLINRQKLEIERSKAEAYKEFAEKLQAFCKEIIAQDFSWTCAYTDFIDDIDNLLKEMVGEDA